MSREGEKLARKNESGGGTVAPLPFYATFVYRDKLICAKARGSWLVPVISPRQVTRLRFETW